MNLILKRPFTLLLLCMAMMLGAAGITTSAQDGGPSTPAAAVTREVINEGYPDAAPGQVLQLVRYTIPPNMLLPVHIHPGMQVVVVESGTLHYTVVEGSVPITRAAAEGTPAPKEQLTSGQETDFGPGDRFVEPAGMVHFGENRTGKPVVLLVASLFESDAPPSTLVEVSPVATPAGG
jgi:quercetin dioxygenase-like cupin family protein